MRQPAAAHPLSRPALRTALLLLAGASALGLGGCKRNQNAPGKGPEAAETASISASAPATPSADATPVDLYRAGRFAEAKKAAEAAIPTTKGREREVNELTAGLSAHALKQYTSAEYYLQPLVGSTDPAIAGRAEAALGQIANAKGNHAYAADLLKRASGKLDGDDAARASVRAGNALNRTGNHAAAVQQYQAAAATADSDAIKAHAEKLQKEPAGPFTVQAGVFSTRAGADKRAQQLAALSTRAGLGAPKVVTATKTGRPTYVVQVGTFPTRDQASSARAKLGTGQYVVVPQQ